MAKTAGRLILIKVDTTGGGSFSTIGGARTKSVTINNEQVDVTNSDSANQWRELLASAGVKSMSISCQGVFDDDAAFNTALGYLLNGTIRSFQAIFPGLGQFDGLFQISSADIGGEYNKETNYSFSLESAGAITFTAS